MVENHKTRSMAGRASDLIKFSGRVPAPPRIYPLIYLKKNPRTMNISSLTLTPSNLSTHFVPLRVSLTHLAQTLSLSPTAHRPPQSHDLNLLIPIFQHPHCTRTDPSLAAAHSLESRSLTLSHGAGGSHLSLSESVSQ
jgi:hypothetical protein